MSTLGYKIGLFNSMYRLYDINNIHFHDGEEMKWAYKTYPAIITLEIPDDAVVSNPHIRSVIYGPYDAPVKIFSNNFLKDLFVKRCGYETFDDDGFVYFSNMDVARIIRDFKFIINHCKCRCNKAKVINVELLEEDGYITSAFTNYHKRLNHEEYFYYKRGEMVYPDDFDESLRRVCSHGIHYFEDPRLAILYAFDFYPGLGNHIRNHSEYICHKYFDITNKED